jgi:hypothetical protein
MNRSSVRERMEGMADDEDEQEWGDGATSFVGPCTCDHDADEHTWGHCDVEDCECEAGWEE